jgi:multiple sugar transport system substrate-binding protein
MSHDFSRRDVFKIGAAGVVAGAAGGMLGAKPAAGAEMTFKPEQGAQLKVLRWTKFVDGDQLLFEANSKKFTEATGVKVTLEYQSWEDIRPKAAVAANVGSGPDIIFGWFDDAHQYPDKLLDVTDVADALGKKYEGWAPVAKAYGTRDNQWIALPYGAAGSCCVYRKSLVEQAGFKEFPKDTDGFLKLCQGLKKTGKPAGFALGHAVGDGNDWVHWLVWTFGGKMIDEKGKVAINSPETLKALEYSKELYDTFIPGTLSWLDPHNNKAFLSDLISLTANGISVWVAAKKDKNPMADDIYHAPYPFGPVGRATELHLFTSGMTFKYTKFPNAAKAYMEFMLSDPQYTDWQKESLGYFTHTLNFYDKNPIWTSDPKITPYRDTVKRMQTNGYAGPLGYSSAATMADYILLDMVAEAASGAATPKDAAAKAEKRARRYYG